MKDGDRYQLVILADGRIIIGLPEGINEDECSEVVVADAGMDETLRAGRGRRVRPCAASSLRRGRSSGTADMSQRGPLRTSSGECAGEGDCTGQSKGRAA